LRDAFGLGTPESRIRVEGLRLRVVASGRLVHGSGFRVFRRPDATEEVEEAGLPLPPPASGRLVQGVGLRDQGCIESGVPA